MLFCYIVQTLCHRVLSRFGDFRVDLIVISNIAKMLCLLLMQLKGYQVIRGWSTHKTHFHESRERLEEINFSNFCKI